MRNGAAIYNRFPDIVVEIVPGELVARDWRLYRGMVNDALEYESEHWEHLDILQRVRSGSWLCLAVRLDNRLTGFCMLEQRKARKGWVLEVIMLGGQGLDLWIDELFEAVTTAARCQKCKTLRVNGRLAWLRILKRYGFKPVAQTLTLEI